MPEQVDRPEKDVAPKGRTRPTVVSLGRPWQGATAQSKWRSIAIAAQPTAPTAAHIEIASRKSITVAPIVPRFVERFLPGHDHYPHARPRNASVTRVSMRRASAP